MFPGHFLIHHLSRFVTRLPRRVSLLPTLPEQPSSPPYCVRGSCYSILVLCFLCFVDRCLSCCSCSFGLCVVCSSSIYRFWLLFGIFKFFSKFKGQSLIEMTSGTMIFCNCFVCHPSIVFSVILPLYFLSSFYCIFCHPSICDFRIRFWFVHAFLRKAHSYDKIILNSDAHQRN